MRKALLPDLISLCILSALLEALFFYVELSFLGFPDGHRTELDDVRGVSYSLFIFFLLLFVLVALRVGYKRLRRQQTCTTKTLIVSFLILNVIFLLFDLACTFRYDNGIGG